MSLIVTGSIGIDSIEAPTGTVENVLGGSSVYFSAAAGFFSPVRLVGVVGDDFPAAFFDTFRQFNVDTSGLELREGSRTFRWRGRYHADMNIRDTLEVQLNVLAETPPKIPVDFRDSEYVFLANTHPAAQIQLLNNFPIRKLAVADTMDLWIETERDALLELLRQIDGLVLNDSEAYQLTGKTNLVRAGETILELGPAFVVIKKGEHGAFLVHKNGLAALPAFALRDVVDPTGAGDCFAGGMMGHIASRGHFDLNTLRMAMACGTVVASFNIESFSLDRLKDISRKDIDQRLEVFRTMINV